MKSFTIVYLLLCFFTQAAFTYDSSSLNINEKAGQVLLLAIRYDANGKGLVTLDQKTKKLIQTIQPGGIILYAQNMNNVGQITALIKDIQSLLKIPAFIAIDEEGGRVSRLKSTKALGTFAIPPASKLAQSGERAVELAYSIIGKNLRALGITMDFAPVLDLAFFPKQDFLGDRSFSKDPKDVTRFGKIASQSLKAQSVIAIGKHFPGIGRAQGDPHKGSFIINAKPSELELDFQPFKDLHDALPGLLSSHLIYNQLGKKNTPASLDTFFYDLARKDFGFNGLIITDSIEMDGIGMDESKAIILALNSGADMIMGPSSSIRAYDAIISAINKKELDMNKINEKIERILKLKNEYQLDVFKNFQPDLKKIDLLLKGGELEKELKKIISP